MNNLHDIYDHIIEKRQVSLMYLFYNELE